MFPQNRVSDGPHKGNLLLPNDSYGLAAGFDLSENMPVRMYLLGRPWTWLVNEGYLIDPAGNGFYSISEDGWEAIEKAKRAPTPAVASAACCSKFARPKRAHGIHLLLVGRRASPKMGIESRDEASRRARREDHP